MSEAQPAELRPFSTKFFTAGRQALALGRLIDHADRSGAKIPPDIAADYTDSLIALQKIRRQARNPTIRRFVVYGNSKIGQPNSRPRCIGLARIALQQTLPGTKITGNITEYWLAGTDNLRAGRHAAVIQGIATMNAALTAPPSEYLIAIGNKKAATGLAGDIAGSGACVDHPLDTAKHIALGLPQPWIQGPAAYYAAPATSKQPYIPGQPPGDM